MPDTVKYTPAEIAAFRLSQNVKFDRCSCGGKDADTPYSCDGFMCDELICDSCAEIIDGDYYCPKCKEADNV